MTIRADADKKFLLKFLLISVACILFAGWSLYDGMYGYPSRLPRAEKYAELKKRLTEQISDEAKLKTELSSQWQVIAKENGWSHGMPETPQDIQGDIWFQWVMFTVCTLIGVPLLIWYFRKKSTWVESDGEKITTSWGKSYDLADATALDKRKWDKKGIAYISFGGNDSPTKFKLDDFMYQREQMGKIMELVESKIPAENITLGKTSQKKPADASTQETTSDSAAN